MLIPIGFFGGGAAAGPFWAMIYGTSTSQYQAEFHGVAADENGNTAFLGRYWDGTSNYRHLWVVTDKTGTITMQKVVNYGTKSNAYNGIMNASGDIYSSGYIQDGGGRTILTKMNKNGTYAWALEPNGLAGVSGGNTLGTDSAGNSYIFQYHHTSTYTVVFKVNTSGGIVWQKSYLYKSFSGQNITADAAGNSYNIGNSSGTRVINKFNTSGSLVYSKAISWGGSPNNTPNIISDASGNCYAIDGTSGTQFLVKLDTNGSVIWGRSFNGANSNNFTSLSFDKDGNIIVMRADGNGLNNFLKFDTSGNLIWQRTLTYPNLYVESIKADSLGNIVWSGKWSGLENAIGGRLPADGSLTGTYALNGINLTWAASSLTISTTSPSTYDWTGYTIGNGTYGGYNYPITNQFNVTDRATVLRAIP
jgi:hypothetical protein